MVTIGLYIFFFTVLIISAYRRIRGLDEPSSKGDWVLEMMDEQAMRQLREQGLEEAERIRQEIEK